MLDLPSDYIELRKLIDTVENQRLDFAPHSDALNINRADWLGIVSRTTALAEVLNSINDARSAAQENELAMARRVDQLTGKLEAIRSYLLVVNWPLLRRLEALEGERGGGLDPTDEYKWADLLSVLSEAAAMAGLTDLETGATIQTQHQVELRYTLLVDVVQDRDEHPETVEANAIDAAIDIIAAIDRPEPNTATVQPVPKEGK